MAGQSRKICQQIRMPISTTSGAPVLASPRPSPLAETGCCQDPPPSHSIAAIERLGKSDRIWRAPGSVGRGRLCDRGNSLLRVRLERQSILSTSTGNRRRCPSEEYPVPKSSSARRTPSAVSAPNTSPESSDSSSMAVSVISRVSRSGRQPVPGQRLGDRPRQGGWVSCRAERLTAMLSGSRCSGRPAFQCATWRSASSSTHLAERHDQPGLLGGGDELRGLATSRPAGAPPQPGPRRRRVLADSVTMGWYPTGTRRARSLAGRRSPG